MAYAPRIRAPNALEEFCLVRVGVHPASIGCIVGVILVQLLVFIIFDDLIQSKRISQNGFAGGLTVCLAVTAVFVEFRYKYLELEKHYVALLSDVININHNKMKDYEQLKINRHKIKKSLEWTIYATTMIGTFQNGIG